MVLHPMFVIAREITVWAFEFSILPMALQVVFQIAGNWG